MSSLLAFRRMILVALAALPMVLWGCGGDENDEPPQILAHQNPVAFQNFAVGAPAQQFQVILMNDGGGTLDITDVQVRGDANCALNPAPALDSPLPVSLTNTEQAFLNMTYIPGGTANGVVGTKDQISIAISSNSAEYPLFEISVCGCVIDHEPTQEDPGPPCDCNLLEVGDANCGG